MTAEERFARIEGGIRDLIVVSRTVLDSMQELRASTQELREAQKHTDDKLNALIQAQIESEHRVSRLADTVDKLIHFRGPNGQAESR
jgi:hypothetical protein